MYKKFDTLSLPTSVNINNTEYEFDADYRTTLKLFKVLNMDEKELLLAEKYQVCLKLFYKAEIKVADYAEAIECMFLFINGGEVEEEKKPQPKLVDWDKDIQKIIAPISKSIGQDIRGIKNLHWWSFLSEYMEIGECRFATIVSIRSKKAKHEKLADWEEKFYKENRNEIDILTTEDVKDKDRMKELMELNQKAIRNAIRKDK